ncbi:hypothetical protein MTO96_038122, partial [Rhipicephalus appendiculatus]
MQVFTQYKDAVAISDSDNDTTFDCLVTRRINIDYEAQTATYIWTFKDSSSRPDVFFQVSRGPKPGTVDMTVGDDPSVKEAVLYYADEKCAVADSEFNGPGH